jgi:hypothetical protein
MKKFIIVSISILWIGMSMPTVFGMNIPFLTYAQKQRCEWYDRGDLFMGKQSCVSQLPMLSVDEHLAYLLPLVE